MDAGDTEGAAIEVGGACAQWRAAHRACCARIAMLPGSRFIEVTARFVRSFAELDAVMRLYSDAAAFDRDLSDALAKAHAAPAPCTARTQIESRKTERQEERRVGQECVITCRYRRTP